MNKQHHIVYERSTDKYWFILPDDAEVEVCKSAIKEIDFNDIYIKLYHLYLSDREKYEKLFKEDKHLDFVAMNL